MFYFARGVEDDHYWVVEELEAVLAETPWRVEFEDGGYRLSHADDFEAAARVFALGGVATPEAAVVRLGEHYAAGGK